MDSEHINKIKYITSFLKDFRDEISKKRIKVSLDRDEIIKRYINNNISIVRGNKFIDTITVLFGANKEFEIGNCTFYTDDKYNTGHKFLFSLVLPNTKESWEIISGTGHFSDLPDDTELRVYTTPKNDYLTFKKKDFNNFRNFRWYSYRYGEFLLSDHFKIQLKLAKQIEKYNYITDDSDDSE